MSLRQVAKELEKLGVKRSHEAIRRWLKKLEKAARQTARKKRSSRVASLPRLQPPKSLRKAAEKLYESLEEAEAPSPLLLKRSLTAKQALSPKHNAGLFPSNWRAPVRGRLSFREHRWPEA